MAPAVNIYCDESCHLPRDGQKVMVLGAISCPVDRVREIAVALGALREKHHLPSAFELKWAKISPAKLDYYLDLVDFFFAENDLKFRAVVAHKTGLRHADYNQTHDDWYYKMMYQLLYRLLKPGSKYRVYLDKKDTRSGQKVKNLHNILGNFMHDFDHRTLERVQIIESHAVVQMQIADMLLGAVSYVNRGLSSSDAKNAVVARIRERSGYALTATTPMREEKFDVFHWNRPAQTVIRP